MKQGYRAFFDIIITERQEIFHASCLLHISHYTCLLIPIHSPVTGNLIPAMLFGTIQLPWTCYEKNGHHNHKRVKTDGRHIQTIGNSGNNTENINFHHTKEDGSLYAPAALKQQPPVCCHLQQRKHSRPNINRLHGSHISGKETRNKHKYQKRQHQRIKNVNIPVLYRSISDLYVSKYSLLYPFRNHSLIRRIPFIPIPRTAAFHLSIPIKALPDVPPSRISSIIHPLYGLV